MESMQAASILLLKGVSSCSQASNHCREHVESFNVDSVLCKYLTCGQGAKLLRFLHQLSLQELEVPVEVCSLCVSVLPLLISQPPSDFNQETVHCVVCSKSSHKSTVRTKSVWKYNNSFRRNKKPGLNGDLKSNGRKRKRRFLRLTGRYYQRHNVSAGISSSEESCCEKLPLKVSTSETVFLKTKIKRGEDKFESPKSLKPLEMMDCDEEKEILNKVEGFDDFRGPFELAGVLLELLQSSFASNFTSAFDSKKQIKQQTTGNCSPMGLAVQLVSAITALQQNKEDGCQHCDNDSLMSQISHKELHWTTQSVTHLQKLIFRSIMTMCKVALNEGNVLQELVQTGSLCSLLKVCKTILKDGGIIPDGYVRKVDRQQQTDDYLSDQSLSNHSLSSTPKKDADCDATNESTDNRKQSLLEHFKFARKSCSHSKISPNISFVCDIILEIFDLVVKSLNVSPGFINPTVLTEVVSLMHEFQTHGGYTLLSSVLTQLTKSTSFLSSNLSPILSPTKSAKSSASQSADSLQATSDELAIVILTSFQVLLNTIQNSKVKYLHKVTCSRHTHRSCDYTHLVPKHHNILGGESHKTDMDDLQGSSEGQSLSPSSNLSSQKLRSNNCCCVVATGLKFLVDLCVRLNTHSKVLKTTFKILNNCGVCHCLAVSTLVLPLLCNLPLWDDAMQNVALALIAKFEIYHFNDDKFNSTISTKKKLSTSSSSLLSVSTTWINHPPLSSYLRSRRSFSRSRSDNWRRSLPGEIMNTEACSMNFKQTLTEFMSSTSQDHPWLFMSLYRALLQLGNSELCCKTLQHLQTVSEHLSQEAKSSLLSNVLVPVLLSFADVGWDALEEEQQVLVETYSERVVLSVLEISSKFLSDSDDCRSVFLRHGGLKAVNQLLYLKTSNIDSNILHSNLLKIVGILMTSQTLLSPQAVVYIILPSSSDHLPFKQTNNQPDPVRSFFRGFSLSWGNDKRKIQRDRSTSLSQTSSKLFTEKSFDLSNNHDDQFTFRKVYVNELSVFHVEVKRFVQNALNITGATSFEKVKEKPTNFTSRFSRAESDSESETRLRHRRLSETSGYRSTSPESMERVHDRHSIHSMASVSSYAAESVSLPEDNHLDQWKNVRDMWDVIGQAVPLESQLYSIFNELNGFDVCMKLLNLITTSLSFYFDPELDFTVSTNDNTLNDTSSLSSDIEPANQEDVSKDDQTSFDGIHGNQNEAMYEEMLKTKLDFFASCLRISLFCAKSKQQFDIEVEDVISIIKPALQGQISSMRFAKLLYSAILRAAVKPVATNLSQEASCHTILNELHSIIDCISAHRASSQGFDQILRSFQASNKSFVTSNGDDDVTISGSDVSEGYEAGSETDLHHRDSEQSQSDVTPSKNFQTCSDPESHDLDFPVGKVIHGELIHLLVELLGNSCHGNQLRRFDSEEFLTDVDIRFDAPVETNAVCDNLLISFMQALSQLSTHCTSNLNTLCCHNDIPSACLSQFSNILCSKEEKWQIHRRLILNLCMTFNKYYLTSEHLQLILSLFHTKDPPMVDLLEHIIELLDHQEYGPSCYLTFLTSEGSNPPLGVSSDVDLDDPDVKGQMSMVYQSITVWKVAPIRMHLDNSVVWPPMDSGVTISIWLQVNSKCEKKSYNLDNGNGLFGEPGLDVVPYVHLLSIGNKQTMLQVWLENTTLIFRVCVDPNDEKPVGLLAQSQCSNLIPFNQWQHLTITYTESKLPDKTILGKVHLILNCFTECDIILEFNLPEPNTKGMLSSWRQSSSASSSSNLSTQKVSFFLGHINSIPGLYDRKSSCISMSSVLPPSVSVGNIMIFNLSSFSPHLAFQLERLGPDASCLTECLTDSTKSKQSSEYRVRFSADSSEQDQNIGIKPTSRLFQLLPEPLDCDVVPEDLLCGDFELDPRTFQESLVLVFSPSESNSYYHSPATIPSTPTKKKKMFRRTKSESTYFDPLTQSAFRSKVHLPHGEVVTPHFYNGLNRALNKVGGTKVFLLLFAKVVEISSSSDHVMDIDMRERLQVLALKSLFKLCSSDTLRREEFLQERMDLMLHKVLTKKECIVSFESLKILFNSSCSDDVIMSQTGVTSVEVYMLSEKSSSIFLDDQLLQTFLLDWRIWHKAVNSKGEKDFSVWMLLLDGIEHLIGDHHLYQEVNIKTLLKVDVVSKLLNGFQEMTNEGLLSATPLPIIQSMISLIRGVIGSPPDVTILSTLCDFLIAVHPPEGTFVCHSVPNFYFSLNNSRFPKISKQSFKKNWKSLEGLDSGSDLRDHKPHLRTSQTPDPLPIKSKLSRASSAPVERIYHPPLPGSSLEDFADSPLEFDDSTLKQDDASEKVDGSILETISEAETKSITRPDSLTLESTENDTTIIDSCDVTQSLCDLENDLEMLENVESWENLPHTTPVKSCHLESLGSETMSSMVTEILRILYVGMMTMRDSDVTKLFGKSLTPEMLIVMTHHKNADVRASVIRLLVSYFSRCSNEEKDNFLQKKGFHLVGNQLHQHLTTKSVAEACMYFLLGHPVAIEEPLPLDGGSESQASPDPFTNNSVIVLLAILEKSFLSDPRICCCLLMRLTEIFECMGPAADVMLDNGLTLALCNLISTVGNHPNALLAEKQMVFDCIENMIISVATKSCTIAGSGHFKVFDDLMTLLIVLERKFVKFYGKNCDVVLMLKDLTASTLLKVLEVMKQYNGGKPSNILFLKQSFDHSDSSLPASSYPWIFSPTTTSSNPSISSPSLTSSYLSNTGITSKFSSVFDPTLTFSAPTSPTLGEFPSFSTVYKPLSPIVASHTKSHRRVFSLGSEMSNVSPRSLVNKNQAFDGSFRPRSGRMGSRSFKGNQRRRINEAETATRLQQVVTIAVDLIIHSESQNKNVEHLKTFAPLPEEEDEEENVLNDEDFTHKDFSQVLFDLLIDWLVTLLEGHSGKVKCASWDRILNIAEEQIAQQASRLFVYFLSPNHNDLQKRTYPLKVMEQNVCENLVNQLFPKDSTNGPKVAVYLHYLHHYYKQQLSQPVRSNIKKLSKIITRIGHRVSSHHRRAIHSAPPSEEPLSPGPLDEFQSNFDKENEKNCLKWRKSYSMKHDLLRNRTSRLAEHVSRHAMEVTQLVVLQQNIQRKKMIKHMKGIISNDLNIRKKWTTVLEQLAHERAVWYNPDQYPKSWQLDPTEGPCRERRRLQRCHIGVDKKFMLNKKNPQSKRGIPVSMDTTKVDSSKKNKIFEISHPRPLGFLFEDDCHSSDSVTIRTRLQTNERISMVQSCTNVTPARESSGELLIGENHIYFVGDEAIIDPALTQVIFGEKEVLSLSWQQRDVREFHKRWWQLRDIALEIFLDNGKTHLLAFNSVKERNLIFDELNKLNLPNLAPSEDILQITRSWCSGLIGNFEYLTKLNKSAGRSFNDLMQYPVMPFILCDYSSQILDLDSPASYRLLEKPISVQEPNREQHFKERYKFLEEDCKNCSEDERELKTPPFHYGSHYSNSGTVLHFLVRLPPFTQLFLEYQDASFDIPDRTFHSMATTFRLSSYASTTDVKEIIPEFFFLPEFLCNLEGFDFGLRQCGLRVHHVTLPLWCREDPRLFVLVHRQALESDYVTSHLHQWIDLVFGFKQTGKEALDAVNVFHPATYFGMDISSVEDPLKRKALETMVKTYGQTPKQLFSAPHPSCLSDPDLSRHGDTASTKSLGGGFSEVTSSLFSGSFRSQETKAFKKIRNLKIPRPIASVKGLQWGEYVGSPAAPEPTVFLHKMVSGAIGSLIPLETNDVCALAPKMGLLVVYSKPSQNKRKDISWSSLVTYDRPDNIVRLRLKHNAPGINLCRFSSDDHVTSCIAAPDCRSVIFGTKSGKIVAQRCRIAPEKGFDLEILPPTPLHCHSSTILCLSVCRAFRIFVSGSLDGTAAIWDLDALCYIRSLTGHSNAVSSTCISQTCGDICTVCHSSNNSGSHIRLWTINGSLVAAQDSKIPVCCVTFSSAPEGRSVNVLAGGLANGCVRLWSSWDLSHVRDVTTHSIHQPIVSLTFSHNSQVLYAATQGGFLVGWCRKDKEKDKQPLLITFLDSKSSGF